MRWGNNINHDLRPALETRYSAKVSNERIMKNHAQVAALGHALKEVFGQHMTDYLIDGLTEYLEQRAVIREQRLKADHPLVEQFWEQFHYLNEEAPSANDGLNHSANEEQIAVHFASFRDASVGRGQPILDFQLLKKLLPGCNRHKFIAANKPVRSAASGKVIKCWIFQK